MAIERKSDMCAKFSLSADNSKQGRPGKWGMFRQLKIVPLNCDASRTCVCLFVSYFPFQGALLQHLHCHMAFLPVNLRSNIFLELFLHICMSLAKLPQVAVIAI